MHCGGDGQPHFECRARSDSGYSGEISGKVLRVCKVIKSNLHRYPIRARAWPHSGLPLSELVAEWSFTSITRHIKHPVLLRKFPVQLSTLFSARSPCAHATSPDRRQQTRTKPRTSKVVSKPKWCKDGGHASLGLCTPALRIARVRSSRECTLFARRSAATALRWPEKVCEMPAWKYTAGCVYGPGQRQRKSYERFRVDVRLHAEKITGCGGDALDG